MHNWFNYIKRGLSRRVPKDPISGKSGYVNIRTNLRNLYPFIRSHRRKGILGLCIIFLVSLLGFPQPLITRYIVDDVIIGKNIGLLRGALLLMIGVALAGKLMGFLEQFYFARFEQRVVLDIQQTLLERGLRFPKLFFDNNQTGYLMSRFSDDIDDVRWFFSSTVLYIATNVVRFGGGVGLLFYLEWRLALMVIVVLPFVGLCMGYFSRKIHVLNLQSMEREAKVSGRLQEVLSSAFLFKAFSSEGRAVGRLMKELKTAFNISLERMTLSAAANLMIGSMPGIARLIVLAFGAYWIIRDQWSLGSLLAFQAYIGYVFGPAQFLATANLHLQKAKAALERVSALFDILPEENMGTGERVDRLRGDIKFEDVSFSYTDREKILRDVSFHILQGEYVAVVGSSGVGKTTLLSLILRFYRPKTGEIYFDGKPASALEVGSLRRRVGYVSQRTTLLSGTIRENLCLGNPHADLKDIKEAARRACIHDFIRQLPDGYETEVGENGIYFSEGQKQRLSIARAIVKDPDILVLDEPTAALDRGTEKSIIRSLPEYIRKKTLFLAANRISITRDAERVILIDDEGFVEIGTHESLWGTNDYYRAVVGAMAD